MRRGKGAWVIVVLCIALAVSLLQHSSRTAQLAQPESKAAKNHPVALWLRHEGVVDFTHLTALPACVLPAAVHSKQVQVRVDSPYAFVGDILVAILFVGGVQPPPGFLDFPPASVGNVAAVVLLHHQPLIPIPTTLGLMTSLQALSAWESFQGPIPSELGNTALLYIDIEATGLTGALPSELGLITTLVSLRIEGSSITHAPSELCQCSQLTTLSLYDNPLVSGTIPPCFLAPSVVRHLAITNARLTGTIPPIGPFIHNVYFTGNSLTGTLPQLESFERLGILDLASNQLSGTIPTEYGAPLAMIVDLRDNNLEGTIPTQFGTTARLQRLLLQNNMLSGPIPSDLGRSTTIAICILHTNELTGTLPSQLGTMRRLETLDVANNLLGGSIPSQLGQLSGLVFLGVAGNNLRGTIPSQLALLQGLRVLDLSNNALTGTLPSQLALLSWLTVLGVANNALTGPLVTPGAHVAVRCDFSGIRDTLCRQEESKFVGDGPFTGVVAAAGVVMAWSLLFAAWLVLRRNSARVRAFGLALGLWITGGMFLVALGVVWYALASVEGSHDARTTYCRVALHLSSYGLTWIVASCTAHLAFLWWRARQLQSAVDPESEPNTARNEAKLLLTVVGLVFVVVVAITGGMTAGVQASSGQGCAYHGPSVVLVALCPAVLVVVAWAVCVVSLSLPHAGGEWVMGIRRALGTGTLFATALSVLAANMDDPVPRFLSQATAGLLAVLMFVPAVHVPLVRAKA